MAGIFTSIGSAIAAWWSSGLAIFQLAVSAIMVAMAIAVISALIFYSNKKKLEKKGIEQELGALDNAEATLSKSNTIDVKKQAERRKDIKKILEKNKSKIDNLYSKYLKKVGKLAAAVDKQVMAAMPGDKDLLKSKINNILGKWRGEIYDTRVEMENKAFNLKEDLFTQFKYGQISKKSLLKGFKNIDDQLKQFDTEMKNNLKKNDDYYKTNTDITNLANLALRTTYDGLTFELQEARRKRDNILFGGFNPDLGELYKANEEVARVKEQMESISLSTQEGILKFNKDRESEARTRESNALKKIDNSVKAILKEGVNKPYNQQKIKLLKDQRLKILATAAANDAKRDERAKERVKDSSAKQQETERLNSLTEERGLEHSAKKFHFNTKDKLEKMQNEEDKFSNLQDEKIASINGKNYLFNAEKRKRTDLINLNNKHEEKAKERFSKNLEKAEKMEKYWKDRKDCGFIDGNELSEHKKTIDQFKNNIKDKYQANNDKRDQKLREKLGDDDANRFIGIYNVKRNELINNKFKSTRTAEANLASSSSPSTTMQVVAAQSSAVHPHQ